MENMEGLSVEEPVREELIAELRERIRYLFRFRSLLNQVKAKSGDRRVNDARLAEARFWLSRLEGD